MNYPGLIGPSYQSQSPVADCEMLMNWYPERLETPYGRNRAALYPTPGFTPFVGAAQGITDVGCRAGFAMNGRSFMVIGAGFYELFGNQTVTRWGSVTQDQYPATISSNGAAGGQLLITSGRDAYSFVLATNTFAVIGALAGLATMGGMVDGYGLVFNGQNSTVYVSALSDFTSWTIGTNYFQRSIAPDPWRAMVIRRSEIILVGEYTGEVWRDVNAAIGQPFAPDLGAVFNAGTSAAWSVKVSDDLVVWLKNTPAGDGTIVAMTGYNPQRISNYGVETAISGYGRASSVADAETLIYSDVGHTFPVFQFPMANGTWAFDTAGGNYWHQRGAWNAPLNRFDMWKPRIYWHAFGRHLVGERATGTIYQMDSTLGTETNGVDGVRRVRVAPPLYAVDGNRMWVDRMDLELQSGVGTQTGQGANPKIMMESSRDYGQTWGTQRMRAVGGPGQFGTRVFWLRNGSSLKSWVPRLTVTDPVPWRIVDASVLGTNIANGQRAA